MLIRERLRQKRPVFSFEFFPPASEAGQATLWSSLQKLALLQPDFVSVTYGAGGSTRTRTIELVRRIKDELGLEPMAHLTCVGATREELSRVLDQLAHAGIENVLALRGDPPRGESRFEATEGGFRHANELIEFIRRGWDFSIGAACYAEVHPEAPSREADLANLARKVEAGADFLITQLFFDNRSYFEFVERARAARIDVPILSGIMPVTNVGQIHRFTQMCGATIPLSLRGRLAEVEDDPQEVFWVGVSHAAHQCRELLQAGDRDPNIVAGVHFYTLNRSPATRAIFEILQLARESSV